MQKFIGFNRFLSQGDGYAEFFVFYVTCFNKLLKNSLDSAVGGTWRHRVTSHQWYMFPESLSYQGGIGSGAHWSKGHYLNQFVETCMAYFHNGITGCFPTIDLCHVRHTQPGAYDLKHLLWIYTMHEGMRYSNIYINAYAPRYIKDLHWYSVSKWLCFLKE